MGEYFSFFIGCAFGLIGLKTLKVAKRVYPYLMKKSYLDSINPKSLNIALISGSTDGLGKSFVQKLYQHNFKMVLLGRSQTKLQNVIQELGSQGSIQKTKTISPYIIDFSQIRLASEMNKINQLSSLLQDKINSQQISNFSQMRLIFINSCGDPHISRYQNTNLQEIQKIQSVNINSFHFLLQVLFRLKSIESFKKMNVSKEFVFINVSSGVDETPNIYSSIYSGSKAYCSNVMKVLNAQNKIKDQQKKDNENITFLNLTPLYIKTKMIRYLNQWDIVEPEKIVNGTFKLLKTKSQGTGTIIHQLLKQFPFIMNKKFNERVVKALQFKNRMIEMQNKRKNRKKKEQ